LIANYGYKDGSGDFFITIDTGKCDGCKACVRACPADCFEVGEDPNDPLRDEPVAIVCDAVRKKIKYVCGQCKPTAGRSPLPCMVACPQDAISHSW
jgi:Fe-S-cluster-containing hydrogenase component 2